MNKFWLIIKDIGVNFVNDGCFYRASSLAFTSLLALVPLVAVSIVVLSYFPLVRLIARQIENFIFHSLIADSGKVLQSYVLGFSQQVIHMSAIGVLILFIMVALLMFSVENTFNAIWKLSQRVGRLALLHSFIRQWLVLLILPVLFGASLVFGSYIVSLNFIRNFIHYIDMPSLVIRLLPTFCVFLAFVIMYKFIPATKVRYRSAIIGGLIGSILFELSKKLFLLYTAFFPTYKILYGAFAVVPLFLLWIYIVWLIILLSAEITWYLDDKNAAIER